MSVQKEAPEHITELGNPRKPQGEYGRQMLFRMNESHSEVTEWGLGFSEPAPHHSVLDIGCGGGAALARMAGLVTTGHLTGVDYSAVSVQTARELNAEAVSAGRMEILEASVEALPFSDDSFDRIITVESFYFWPSPKENLNEVLRVLKHGGVFLLIADIFECEALTLQERENIEKYQLFNPTPDTFRSLFEAAGFTAVQVHLRDDGKTWICVEGRKA